MRFRASLDYLCFEYWGIEMSNEMAVYGLSDMQKMAESIARSGLFGMKTADQALALMLVAQAEGQHPATITQDYDLIQGKACRKTHSVMARFQQMGGKVEWHQLNDEIADATFSHAAGGSLRMTWTFAQAKKAGLTGKDNWVKYPRAMLRARVIAEGVRAVYPAAIGGLLVAEEAQDLTVRDMGVAEQIKTIEPELPMITEERLEQLYASIESVTTLEELREVYLSGNAEMLAAKYDNKDFKQACTDRSNALKALTVESEPTEC